jgi:hypothetical protein
MSFPSKTFLAQRPFPVKSFSCFLKPGKTLGHSFHAFSVRKRVACFMENRARFAPTFGCA